MCLKIKKNLWARTAMKRLRPFHGYTRPKAFLLVAGAEVHKRKCTDLEQGDVLHKEVNLSADRLVNKLTS